MYCTAQLHHASRGQYQQSGKTCWSQQDAFRMIRVLRRDIRWHDSRRPLFCKKDASPVWFEWVCSCFPKTCPEFGADMIIAAVLWFEMKTIKNKHARWQMFQCTFLSKWFVRLPSWNCITWMETISIFVGNCKHQFGTPIDGNHYGRKIDNISFSIPRTEWP